MLFTVKEPLPGKTKPGTSRDALAADDSEEEERAARSAAERPQAPRTRRGKVAAKVNPLALETSTGEKLPKHFTAYDDSAIKAGVEMRIGPHSIYEDGSTTVLKKGRWAFNPRFMIYDHFFELKFQVRKPSLRGNYVSSFKFQIEDAIINCMEQLKHFYRNSRDEHEVYGAIIQDTLTNSINSPPFILKKLTPQRMANALAGQLNSVLQSHMHLDLKHAFRIDFRYHFFNLLN